MKFFFFTGIVCALSSVSQALYVPGYNEKPVYQCANDIVDAEVSQNSEGDFKLKMTPHDAGIVNLYVDEKVHNAETPKGRIFTSQRIVLKIDHNEMGIERSSLMVALNPSQVERMELDCQLMFSIMQDPVLQ